LLITYIDLIKSIHREFEESSIVYGHGTTNAWDEAVALVKGITGLPDNKAMENQRISEVDYEHVKKLAYRRIHERTPLPYLLGKVDYVGLSFFCEEGVIIPRSPMGRLIQDGLSPWLRRSPEKIVDVCAGSGCLGILAALKFPKASVVLVDIDDRALSIAKKNVFAFGLADRVFLQKGDLLENFSPSSIDLIISNPPYVPSDSIDLLPQEYQMEPALAFDGGADGLGLVTELLEQATAVLSGDGAIICEVGQNRLPLSEKFPMAEFMWVDLAQGGEGVFFLEKGQMGSFRDLA